MGVRPEKSCAKYRCVWPVIRQSIWIMFTVTYHVNKLLSIVLRAVVRNIFCHFLTDSFNHDVPFSFSPIMPILVIVLANHSRRTPHVIQTFHFNWALCFIILIDPVDNLRPNHCVSFQVLETEVKQPVFISISNLLHLENIARFQLSYEVLFPFMFRPWWRVSKSIKRALFHSSFFQ